MGYQHFVINHAKKSMSKLLADFISKQLSGMKKHHFFLVFIKRVVYFLFNSTFSTIKGLKILIRGRINGNRRKKKRIITVGKIPLQSFSKKIDYSYATSYSNYGTFG